MGILQAEYYVDVMRCSRAIIDAVEPSATAAATRLMDPARISPAAKTPDTDVQPGHAVTSGENETVIIEVDHVLKPVGGRPRADEDEECAGLEHRPRSRWSGSTRPVS
jgi:hypothetical protein